MSTDRVGGSGIVHRHKATHATGGTDALTPADIGALSTTFASGLTGIVALTQAQYNALTPSATVLYIITD